MQQSPRARPRPVKGGRVIKSRRTNGELRGDGMRKNKTSKNLTDKDLGDGHTLPSLGNSPRIETCHKLHSRANVKTQDFLDL